MPLEGARRTAGGGAMRAGARLRRPARAAAPRDTQARRSSPQTPAERAQPVAVGAHLRVPRPRPAEPLGEQLAPLALGPGELGAQPARARVDLDELARLGIDDRQQARVGECLLARIGVYGGDL